MVIIVNTDNIKKEVLNRVDELFPQITVSESVLNQVKNKLEKIIDNEMADDADKLVDEITNLYSGAVITRIKEKTTINLLGGINND
ncbi:hypothetical protein [Pediococcus pentosaceus]|uniref:hypothetical protein n=1 Tax=Pediococcus pentosaceus TaxID=1255 RepID=UPI001C7CC7AF|nr:hypothetical protein [Pediococcus pentosaceus]QYY85562.1 hypothetical protein GRI00_02925 [Pediococcus pentosaceus]